MQKYSANRQRIKRIRLLFEPHTRVSSKSKFVHVTFNALGRAILRKNPELVKILKTLKNKEIFSELQAAKREVTINGLTLKLVGSSGSDYWYGNAYRLTLPNGRDFALKVGNMMGDTARKNLQASYELMLRKRKTIKYYLQVELPYGNYVVLMDYAQLPTANYLFSRASSLTQPQRQKLRTQLNAEIKSLEQRGFWNVSDEDCFVRQLGPEKFELVFFDTHLKKEKFPKHFEKSIPYGFE